LEKFQKNFPEKGKIAVGQMRALLVAVLLTAAVGAGLAALPEGERPGEITVLVMTDGHENASSEWTAEAVRRLIAQQETDYSWDFIFLGANMDAVDVGVGLGFAAAKSLTFDADGDGVAGAWDAVSNYSARKRSRGTAPLASLGFDPAERRRAHKRR
jgi:hypothetical protein